MTGVNAELANSIRQGKLAGLSGMAGVGGQMGGLSSQEAGRMLQAGMANQNADLQAQQLSEQSLQALRQNQLAGLHGQTSLYGTTPALASTFGNQALNAYQNRINLEQMRNTTGLGLLDAQIRAYGQQQATEPWWKQALNAAGSVLPYLGGLGNKPNAGPSGSTPMGYNTPNNMQGTSFQGYQAQMPSGTPGNYNPQTSSNWGISPRDPNYSQYLNNPYYGNPFDSPYDQNNDPYLNPGNWYGYGPATNGQQFSGWEYPMPGYDFGPEYGGGDSIGYDPWGPGSGSQQFGGEWFDGVYYPYGSS
jgi:hypothetical protein